MYWHYERHGVFSVTQASLAFFLGLNFIVCLWEFVLYFEMPLIETKSKFYSEQFTGRPLDIAVYVFTMDVHPGNVFSSKLWAEVSRRPPSSSGSLVHMLRFSNDKRDWLAPALNLSFLSLLAGFWRV